MFAGDGNFSEVDSRVGTLALIAAASSGESEEAGDKLLCTSTPTGCAHPATVHSSNLLP